MLIGFSEVTSMKVDKRCEDEGSTYFRPASNDVLKWCCEVLWRCLLLSIKTELIESPAAPCPLLLLQVKSHGGRLASASKGLKTEVIFGSWENKPVFVQCCYRYSSLTACTTGGRRCEQQLDGKENKQRGSTFKIFIILKMRCWECPSCFDGISLLRPWTWCIQVHCKFYIPLWGQKDMVTDKDFMMHSSAPRKAVLKWPKRSFLTRMFQFTATYNLDLWTYSIFKT